MQTLGFGHINLRCHRALLDELYRFYTDVVGLSEGPRPPFNRFGYWLYLGEHDLIHLIEASPEDDRLVDVVTTIDHIAFVCRGRAAFEAKLEALGVPYRASTVPLTRQHQLILKDPAGNTVELNFAG